MAPHTAAFCAWNKDQMTSYEIEQERFDELDGTFV